MVHVGTYGNRLKSALAFFLILFPACTAFQKNASDTPPQTIDPRIQVLQRENRQMVDNQLSIQKAVEDIYKRLNALDAKLDFLDTRIDELAAGAPSATDTTDVKAEKSTPPAKAAASAKDKTKAVPPRKTSAKKAASAPKRSAQKQYDQAYSAYISQRFDQALAMFKDLLKNHPDHDLADNAQYWVGEIYYDLENYPAAILAFKEVVTKYGEKDKAPDALLKIGYAYMALDDPGNARLFLKRVVKNYPFSNAEAKARIKLKEISKL